MDLAHLAATLDESREVLRGFPSDRQALRMVQQLIDSAEAARAELSVAVERDESYRDDGVASMKTWLRTELHLDSAEAGRVLTRGATLRELPHVRESARAGRIGPHHIDWYSYGLKYLGEGALTDEHLAPALAQIAQGSEPAQLKAAVKEVRDQLTPDELDRAWIRGMDKADLQVHAVGEHGFAVSGFLPIVLGAKFQALLDALGRPGTRATCEPDEVSDDRTPSQRRLEGLEALVDGVLENGLPSDRGIRPHVSVLVDADEVAKLADPTAQGLTSPAHLVGFGSIGRGALGLIMCGGDLRPVLTGGKQGVLDVGRRLRCATPDQRTAVTVRQGGECAAPGCTHRISQVHHVTWYSVGGATDLDNLIGLCVQCHSLVHAGKLHIDSATHVVTRPNRPPERRNRSTSYLTRRIIAARLHEALRPRQARPPRPLDVSSRPRLVRSRR